jgi:hypothetical protein
VNIGAVRDELAAAAATVDGVHGYREPPDTVELPAVIVRDPRNIRYHETMSGRFAMLVELRVVVGLGAGAAELDALLSYSSLPSTLEHHEPTGAVWRQLACEGVSDGYRDYIDGAGKRVGLCADLRIEVSTHQP